MTRIILVALMACSSLSLAHGRHHRHGVGIYLGSVDIGFHVHTHERVVAQPYVYPTPAPAPVYAQAPVYATPPPVYAPQPVYPMPMPMAVPVMPIPMQAVAQRAPVKVESTPLLGVKYLAGISVPTSTPNGAPFKTFPGINHTIGIEIRPANWFAVRSDLELRPAGASWDIIGAKLSIPSRFFRPFASVSLTSSMATAEKIAFGITGSAGVDLFFGKHFFIEAEARYRVLPSGCCEVPGVVSGSVGAGLALF
jgi:hypothetical protein